jgi:hypothetical protein
MVDCLDPKMTVIASYNEVIYQSMHFFILSQRVNRDLTSKSSFHHPTVHQFVELRLDGQRIPAKIFGYVLGRIDSVRILMKESDQIPFDERIYLRFHEIEQLRIHIFHQFGCEIVAVATLHHCLLSPMGRIEHILTSKGEKIKVLKVATWRAFPGKNPPIEVLTAPRIGQPFVI